MPVHRPAYRPAHWKEIDTYRDETTIVTVYRPRSAPSIGTWVVVAGALLLGVIGSDTGASDGSAATAARTSASPRATEPPTAVVRAPGGLPVRGEPRPDAAQLSRLADGSWVVVACHTAGPPVVGRTGTSAVWVRVAPTEGAAGFVPDAMLSTQGDIRARVPAC